MITTTIQVRKTTLQCLEKLKSRYHARSFDQVLQRLMQKDAPKSRFGAHKEMKPFKRDKEDFHEL